MFLQYVPTVHPVLTLCSKSSLSLSCNVSLQCSVSAMFLTMQCATIVQCDPTVCPHSAACPCIMSPQCSVSLYCSVSLQYVPEELCFQNLIYAQNISNFNLICVINPLCFVFSRLASEGDMHLTINIVMLIFTFHFCMCVWTCVFCDSVDCECTKYVCLHSMSTSYWIVYVIKCVFSIKL